MKAIVKRIKSLHMLFSALYVISIMGALVVGVCGAIPVLIYLFSNVLLWVLLYIVFGIDVPKLILSCDEETK